jgi:hypothetical protein
MVDFSFISARFLGADDADEVIAAPGEDNAVDLRIGSAQRRVPQVSILRPGIATNRRSFDFAALRSG